MVILRNRISQVASGGPRQFAELRDKVMVKVESFDEAQEVRAEMDNIDLRSETLSNIPVIIAEPRNKIEDTLDRVRLRGDDNTKIRQGIQEIQDARDKGDNILDTSMATISATRELMNQIRLIPQVNKAEFVRTEADYGPENLRRSLSEMDNLDSATATEREDNLADVNERLEVPKAWSQTRGENAIIAIFDTGFAKDLIAPGRVINTFNGADASSPYKSSEGHGTMCAGAAAANTDDGVPFNGVAPDADMILVRTTDDEGQIRGDYISQGWDFLMGLDHDRPIIANHSYGTPLCSGRPRTKFCDTVQNDVIKLANSTEDITSVYAAGNEAMRCGHRLFGFTSAVTGTNSLGEVITVGALLSSGSEAQKYSSHGRGDCSPIGDPKPNVSCAIPKYTYYGGEDGYVIKDMSSGFFGSSGGTSHASPMTCGMIALLQSKAYDEREVTMETEEIKQILHKTAKPPRRTQVNSVGLVLGQKGYDARFGYGQVNINEALKMV